MKIGVYTRHKLEDFSKYLATSLSQRCEVFVFSEDHLKGNEIISAESFSNNTDPAFYFGESDVDDIISRCRVLRSIDKELALVLLRRAFCCIEGLLDSLNPDVVVAPRIDNYFLDILNRVCECRSIVFIGLWRSAFYNDMFFSTSRGEVKSIRQPKPKEVYKFIEKVSKKTFRGTSLVRLKDNKVVALKRYSKLLLRAYALETIRKFSSNKFRYREMATRFFVEEYDVSLRDIFFDYKDWNTRLEDALTNGRPRVFFALQVNPESTIDYYCGNVDLIQISSAAKEIVRSFLDSGFVVIVKDHPNMVGNRPAKLLVDLAQLGPDVVVVPPSVDSTFLIEKSDLVFTWSGTVSVQAIVMGRKAVCVCSPYFINIKGLYKINSVDDLKAKLKNGDLIYGKRASKSEVFSLAQHILSTHLKGQVFLHNSNMNEGFDFPVENLWLLIERATENGKNA
ncbi:hypothetical protein N9Y91_01225 [Alphaproteobacteria bacterium]|nr:hypothetical protein [Alphaproteobacteria bacterium]